MSNARGNCSKRGAWIKIIEKHTELSDQGCVLFASHSIDFRYSRGESPVCVFS